jgi:hypothetical protein
MILNFKKLRKKVFVLEGKMKMLGRVPYQCSGDGS